MKQNNINKIIRILTILAMAIFVMASVVGCNVNVSSENIGTVIEGEGAENGINSADISDNDGTLQDESKNIPVPVELQYATQFSAEHYENGYVHVHIEDGTDYIIVPEGKEKDSLGFDNPVYIEKPLENVYLAASSAMDLVRQTGSLDKISCCSTKAEDYRIEEAADRIEKGLIQYVGKYSAPDYETLVSTGCTLAIESTMINHSPKIKEELESLGIPVMVERSSYESDPLGRLEWIKLYGLLFDREEQADAFFQKKCALVEESMEKIDSLGNANHPKVAFFYITSSGYVNVRKPGDYFSRMIEMAGGKYALQNISVEEENQLSTMNVGWEEFYTFAKDADIIIYNSTIDGGIASIQELIGKNSLLADFDAVRNGNVWCTNKSVYQESGAIADMILELSEIVAGNRGFDYNYFYEIK